MSALGKQGVLCDCTSHMFQIHEDFDPRQELERIVHLLCLYSPNRYSTSPH